MSESETERRAAVAERREKAWGALSEQERELRLVLAARPGAPDWAIAGQARQDVERALVVQKIPAGYEAADVIAVAVRGSPPRALALIFRQAGVAYIHAAGRYRKVEKLGRGRAAQDWATIERFLRSREVV